MRPRRWRTPPTNCMRNFRRATIRATSGRTANLAETHSMDQTITLNVNGEARSVTTDPDRPLLDVLREDLDLTGAKYGCGERQCGACTVLVDGRPVFSCSTRVSTVGDK